MTRDTEIEIQPADPSARRAALAIVGILTVLGFALLVFVIKGRPALTAWLEEDPGTRIRWVLVWLGATTVVPLLGFGAYLWLVGMRIVHAERYPLPGAKVMRDTPVLSGDAARIRGRFAQALAVLLGVAAALLASSLWRLASLL